MFMAVPINPGYHEIELVFVTPGLKMGCIITAISSLVLIVILVIEKRKYKKMKEKREVAV